MGKFRFGSGRQPDPDRPGTVYRAGPGWRRNKTLSGTSQSAGAAGLAPAAPSARSSKPVAHRPRRRWLSLPIIAWMLLVVFVIYPLALFAIAWFRLEKVDALSDGAGGSGTTYLVVGNSSRRGLERSESARLRVGRNEAVLADTIMVLHTSMRGTTLISIPRDTKVDIPGHGRNGINAAYSLGGPHGGPKLLTRTVEQNMGVHIDHYIETGFDGYANVVDAMGGVNVCVKRPMKDDMAHINLKAGCQDMDGVTALGFARARHYDPTSDFARVQNQRQILSSITSKMLSPVFLIQPWRTFPTAWAGGSALKVDDRMTPWGLGQFVWAMRSVSGGNGVQMTIPADRQVANRLFRALTNDDFDAVRTIAGK